MRSALPTSELASATCARPFLPGDEIVLHAFEAPSPEALDEAGRRASLPFERIVEAVEGSADTREEET